MTFKTQISGIGCVSSLGEGVGHLMQTKKRPLPLPERVFDQAPLEETLFYQGSLPEQLAVSAYRCRYWRFRTVR